MLSQKLDKHSQAVIDAASRQLICCFAALDDQRPLPNVETDWNAVLDMLDKHGLISMAHTYHDVLPTEFRQEVAEEHQVNLFYTRLMHRRTATVLTALNAAKIDYLVVKGPVLAYTVYPDPLLRPYKDLDIIVRERDWSRIHHQLISMGYVPVNAGPQPPPRLIPQQVLYEAEYRHPETRLLVEVHYDDILNAGLRSRDVEGFWQRAIKHNIAGQPAYIMALSDQLLHLCAHAHHHAYSEIKWLTDIALIVRDHADELDWNQFIATTQIEEAQVSAYYSLIFMGAMLDIHAPDWVLAVIQPDAFRRFWHEYYLPTTQITAMQPIQAPLLSFYFLPLLTRLLPDLLVMGRRPEKFYFLLRLLYPPPDWLRDYYELAPDEPLFIHYALHPAKLAYHYLDEIINHIFRRQRKP